MPLSATVISHSEEITSDCREDMTSVLEVRRINPEQGRVSLNLHGDQVETARGCQC
jgi:hypothetical protein